MESTDIKEEPEVTPSEAAKADSTSVDDEFEIEVVDDTPEEDRGRPRRKEGEAPKIPTDQELESYSEGVQQRIKQLRYEYHEERRAKEEAQRERAEAIRIAQLQQKRIQELQQYLESGRKTLHDVENANIDARLAAARAAFNKAFEDGDSAAMAKASEEIAAATAARERLKVLSWQPVVQPQPTQPVQQPVYQQQNYPRVQPDPKAVEWASRNPWFGRDQRMTAVAYAIHQEMAESGSIKIGSDEYYKKLDNEMRNMFPSYFTRGTEEPPRKQPGSVVAPASRSVEAKPRRRQITLTSTQLRIAKKLGISPEQYAREMLNMEREGEE